MKKDYNTPNSIQKTAYEDQEKISFLGLLFEVPSFLILAVSSWITFSPLVWIDFLDSMCYILQSGLVFIISKKLKKDNYFSYNYGIERIESMTAFTCDILLCIGTLCVITLSIDGLIHPSPQSCFLLYVFFLKISEVLIDGFLFLKQAEIYKHDDSAVIKTEYYGAAKDMAFDFVSLILIGVCCFFHNYHVTSCFASIAALIICAVFLKGRITDIKQRISDLTDKTLDEQHQLMILKILNQYNSHYSIFHSVNSHKIDKKTFIDFHLDFTPETTFSEIIKFENSLQRDMQEHIKDCDVSIVITSSNANK